MNALRERLHRHGVDRGVSLVEVLVASVLLLVVLPTAGGLLHSAVVAQRDVRSVTETNTAAQVIASSVEAGVRNAAAIRLTASGSDGADELLVTRARIQTVGSTGWVCQAWFYSAADDVLYTRRVPVTATTVPVAAPTATTRSQWSTLGSGVTPRTATRVFALSADLRRVDLEITVSTGTQRRPADLSTSIVRRPQGQTKGTPCF